MLKLIKFFLKILIQYPICLFFLIIIYIVRPIIVIRIGILSSWRMGHFAHDPEIYLANKNFSKSNYLDLIVNTKIISNSFLKKKWSKKINFLYPEIGFPLFKINKFLINYFNFPKQHQLLFTSYDGNNLIEKSEQNILLDEKEKEDGWKILKSIGIHKSDKIVCLDVRDNAYLSFRFPGRDWSYQDSRDCDIQKFISLTKFLNKQGYYVFRMGRKVNKKMNYSHEKYFEYCNSEIQSDFLDVFLASICDFVISTGTGWAAIPTFNFRKPAIYCNSLPVGEFLTHSKKIMLSTKIHYSKKINKNLNLKEIMQQYAFSLHKINKSLFEVMSEELILKEHNEEELLLIVKEFLNYKNLGFKRLDINEKKIQEKFWQIYSNELEILKKNYKNSFIHENHKNFFSAISVEFLKKNEYLIQ